MRSTSPTHRALQRHPLDNCCATLRRMILLPASTMSAGIRSGGSVLGSSPSVRDADAQRLLANSWRPHLCKRFTTTPALYNGIAPARRCNHLQGSCGPLLVAIALTRSGSASAAARSTGRAGISGKNSARRSYASEYMISAAPARRGGHISSAAAPMRCSPGPRPGVWPPPPGAGLCLGRWWCAAARAAASWGGGRLRRPGRCCSAM